MALAKRRSEAVGGGGRTYLGGGPPPVEVVVEVVSAAVSIVAGCDCGVATTMVGCEFHMASGFFFRGPDYMLWSRLREGKPSHEPMKYHRPACACLAAWRMI